MSTMSFGPNPKTAAELLARQAALQLQAGDVITDLNLIRLLTPIGHPIVVGSVVTGLMVWRDIDVNVLCNNPNPDHIWAAIRPLASHSCVKKLRWTNERGPFNSTCQPQDEGYYLSIHYHEEGTNAGERWKVDCWFLPLDAPRPEFALIDRMRRELTDETRLAILWIKGAWYRLPAYRHSVSSIDIYTAVLDHGIRTPDEFAEWLRSL